MERLDIFSLPFINIPMQSRKFQLRWRVIKDRKKNANSQVQCLEKISKHWSFQDTCISFWRSNIFCSDTAKRYLWWWSYQLTKHTLLIISFLVFFFCLFFLITPVKLRKVSISFFMPAPPRPHETSRLHWSDFHKTGYLNIFPESAKNFKFH